MRQKWLILGLLAFGLMGGGCWNKQQTPNDKQPEASVGNPLPTLDILTPGLSTTTKNEKIQITGTTNRDAVWVGGKRQNVTDGKFESIYDLQTGENAIPVAVSNGVATTTITVNVTREAPDAAVKPSTAGNAATAKPTVKTTTTVKPTATPTKTDANPTATQLKVEFVGGELALTVSPEPNGVTLTWGKAADPFQTYVIVKSTVDASPYFPKQFWIKAFSDVDVRSWRDTAAEAHKTTYYRVCKIKPDQSVACGNVGKITLP